MNALLFPCGVEGSLCTRFGLGAGKRTVVGFALLGLVKSIGFDLLGLVGFAALGLVWFCCLRAKNAWMPVVMPSLPVQWLLRIGSTRFDHFERWQLGAIWCYPVHVTANLVTPDLSAAGSSLCTCKLW